MLVDDDEAVRQALFRVLRKEFDVGTAADGSEAMPLVVGGRFDVVLSDVNMPEMSGIEMLDALHVSSPALVDKIVLMTGDMSQPAVMSLAQKTVVLQKPVDVPELMSVLLKVAKKPMTLGCPECGSPMELMGGMWGLQYRCTKDTCGGSHGAHPDGAPLGTPADAKTRRARALAHGDFDRIWEHGVMSRSEAYAWLSRRLNGGRPAHIGSMGAPECARVSEAVRSAFPDLFPFDQDP